MRWRGKDTMNPLPSLPASGRGKVGLDFKGQAESSGCPVSRSSRVPFRLGMT